MGRERKRPKKIERLDRGLPRIRERYYMNLKATVMTVTVPNSFINKRKEKIG
jgi:hypothetical protein